MHIKSKLAKAGKSNNNPDVDLNSQDTSTMKDAEGKGKVQAETKQPLQVCATEENSQARDEIGIAWKGTISWSM